MRVPRIYPQANNRSAPGVLEFGNRSDPHPLTICISVSYAMTHALTMPVYLYPHLHIRLNCLQARR